MPSSNRVSRNGELLTLVPVAAILVASIRLHCLKMPLDLAYRGPNVMPCDAEYKKGEEMGWFEHGSTIVMLAPASWAFAGNVEFGKVVRMGQPLFRLPLHRETLADLSQGTPPAK